MLNIYPYHDNTQPIYSSFHQESENLSNKISSKINCQHNIQPTHSEFKSIIGPQQQWKTVFINLSWYVLSKYGILLCTQRKYFLKGSMWRCIFKCVCARGRVYHTGATHSQTCTCKQSHFGNCMMLTSWAYNTKKIN